MSKFGEISAGLITHEEAKKVPRHRTDDHHTSVKAAKKTTKRAPSGMTLVYRAIEASGSTGLIDDELQHYMVNDLKYVNQKPDHWRKRRSDLAKLDYVIWNGNTRKGSTGTEQKVWVINPEKKLED